MQDMRNAGKQKRFFSASARLSNSGTARAGAIKNTLRIKMEGVQTNLKPRMRQNDLKKSTASSATTRRLLRR